MRLWQFHYVLDTNGDFNNHLSGKAVVFFTAFQ